MEFRKWVIILVLISGCLTPWIIAKKTVVCYMAAWAISRKTEGRFSVRNADTEHCTHIIYAFMGLDSYTSEIKSIDPYIDQDKNGRGQNQLGNLKELKKSNPDLKILASIGGKNERGSKFSKLAADPELRQTFIMSVTNFLTQYKLDGIDICWQFPGLNGGRIEDKENSVILFQELKTALQPEGYLLTVHILGKRYIMDVYDLKEISEVVDLVNLMAVEYSGPWHKTTGVMAPLRTKDQNNVQFAVDYALKKGVPPNKLLLGLPLYGHAYILEKKPDEDHLIGLFSVETFREPWTNERGIIGYHESCHNFKYTRDGWINVWHEDSQTPLAFKDKYFVSYDNERSLLLKADLVDSRSLGGVAFWSMDTDDFRGLCFGKKFPMISAVSDYINKKYVSTPLKPNESTSDKGSNVQGNNEETDDLGPPDA